MKLKRYLIRIGLLVVVLAGTAGVLYLIYLRPFLKHLMVMTTSHPDRQLTLVTGGGGNSGILTSDSAVLVVDTKMAEGATAFYDMVKKIAGSKPIIIVNTHIHGDHAKGNALYKGATIIAGARYDKDQWTSENGDASLPNVWVKDSLILHLGDETVTILNLGFDAHTQSDVVVYLQNRQLLFTGDLVLNQQAPALFSSYRASGKGYLAAFDTLEHRFVITTVVPGHGPIGTRDLIDTYRTFFQDMYVAALDHEKKPQLLTKYSTWWQIPFMMSPDATISYIQKEKQQ
ncbi:MAG: MBL fold metallo-hydrolase [Bacteroidetes bacterium]|nr:MBL fold metallo-hydrolase [Bacteroidota bacterium]